MNEHEQLGPSAEYKALLRGEMSSEDYVAGLRLRAQERVNRDLARHERRYRERIKAERAERRRNRWWRRALRRVLDGGV